VRAAAECDGGVGECGGERPKRRRGGLGRAGALVWLTREWESSWASEEKGSDGPETCKRRELGRARDALLLLLLELLGIHMTN
jgi:hypothetical protein